MIYYLFLSDVFVPAFIQVQIRTDRDEKSEYRDQQADRRERRECFRERLEIVAPVDGNDIQIRKRQRKHIGELRVEERAAEDKYAVGGGQCTTRRDNLGKPQLPANFFGLFLLDALKNHTR